MKTPPKKNNRSRCPAMFRIAALAGLVALTAWFAPLLSCATLSDTTTHTYCADQSSTATLIADIAELALMDDNDTAVAVTGNLMTVTHAETDSADAGDVTITYDTASGAARRLSATITTVAALVTSDRNDYTCDNGTTGSYSYDPGCDSFTSGGYVSDGSDCAILDFVYPALPETFTVEFAE